MYPKVKERGTMSPSDRGYAMLTLILSEQLTPAHCVDNEEIARCLWSSDLWAQEHPTTTQAAWPNASTT